LLGLAAALVALPLAACRADVSVGVTVDRSGAGTVSATVVLDRQAVAVVGDHLDVTDLVRAGWRVVGPLAAADGSETFRATHAFARPADGTALLATLGAPVHLRITDHHATTSSSVGVAGTVDLRGGLDALAASPGVGASLATVAKSGGAVPTVTVEVAASLPGRPTGITSGGTAAGDTVTWAAPLGALSTIGAVSTRADTAARHWLDAAAALAAALVLVVAVELGWAVRGGRARHRRSRSDGRQEAVATEEAVVPPS